MKSGAAVESHSKPLLPKHPLAFWCFVTVAFKVCLYVLRTTQTIYFSSCAVWAGLAEQHTERAQAGCFCALSPWRQCESWLRRGQELRNFWSVHFPQAKACEWVTVGPGTWQLTLGRKAEVENESLVYSALRLGIGAVTTSSTSDRPRMWEWDECLALPQQQRALETVTVSQPWLLVL